ncbi:MAG: hypothetical protein ACR2PK_15350 [Acidimicrobiales bacterium]
MDGTIRIRTAAWFATAVVLSIACTLLVTQAWSAGAAPGDDDSTFVPTAGCRITDTRPAPNTVGLRSAPLGAGDIFEVRVHGENGECAGPLAIPDDAVAIASNVTAVNATERSNIRIYPADLTEVPLLSNLNVTAGAPPTPNKVDVKLSPDGKLRVFNFNGNVNIFIDIVGYYTNSTLQELSGQVADLKERRSFSVSTVEMRDTPDLLSPTTYEALVTLEIAAPVDGRAVLHSTAGVQSSSTNHRVVCLIVETAEIANLASSSPPTVAQVWTPRVAGASDSLSGAGSFEISAGDPVEYSLACRGTGFVEDRSLEATFTPSQ